MRYDKKTLHDVNVENKTVIVRLDLNVPIKDGKITNEKRIVSALDTLKYLIDKNSKIIVLSHLGRIKTLEDIKKGTKSLEVVAKRLQELLPETKVTFLPENKGDKVTKAVKELKEKEILVLENTRYNDVDSKDKVVKLESKNDPALGKFWASLADVYVNDAFGTAHRAHASNVGIAKNIKESCVGFLVQKELEMLGKACDEPEKPLVAILGGAKVLDKIKTIDAIAEHADAILIGGAMAFPFHKAQGKLIGKSLCDDESVEAAKKLLEKYNDKLVVAIDSVYADSMEQTAKTKNISADAIDFNQDLMGLDIGKKTIKLFKKYLANAKTIIWNGPLGLTEVDKFAKGTTKICKILAKLGANGAFTLIGGGDSAAAAIKLGFEPYFTHISTGGGASLAYLENSELPGIESISDRKEKESSKEESKKSTSKKAPAKKSSAKKTTKK